MREQDRDPGRLTDILQAADYVSEFIEGYSFETFFEDKMRYYAVLKNVEIIGEAAYMLSLEFKEQHNEVPWKQIIKMRHILVHGYASVLPEILWETATEDIPSLAKTIRKIMQDQS